MARNTVLYVLLRAIARILILPWLPLSLVYRLAEVAGSAAYWLVPGARSGVESNVATVLGKTAAPAVVRHYAREAFRNDAKNWVDTLRIRSVTPEHLAAVVEIEGWEHLDEALAGGKGAILLSMHLGNFDLVGQVLALRGYDLTVPVERMEPAALFDFLTAGRQSKGLHLVPLDRAPRELLRALRAGRLVGMTGDRYIAGKGIRVPFFGRCAVLPAGPVSLARITGAPLLLAYGLRLPSNRFQGYIAPPLFVDHSADEHSSTARIAAWMEGPIRDHLGQWLAFSPVWPPENGPMVADSMKGCKAGV